ncbi:MAG: putative ral secretion pathway protein component of type secretion system [Pseudomonadota bacterium]|jgi:general secretion pathway protein M
MMPPALRTASHTASAWWRQHWQALPQRERLLVSVALGVLALALLWWVALQPALTTLRNAPAQRQALDLQLQRMRQLQAQATAMRSTLQPLPPLAREDAQRALEAAVRQQFGNAARLTLSADAATLNLSGVSGQALAQWLAQARIEARSRPTEARLERQANGSWKGQMTLSLPGTAPAR